MSLKIKALRFGMFAALGLTMVLSTACGETCETNDDCEEGFVCNTETNECEEIPADLCANVECPGVQTCDDATGLCTGVCCADSLCPDFRRECDEDLCLAGESNFCVEKVCDPACGEDEVCNVRMDPPVCEQACLTQGCDDPNAACTEDGCVKAPAPEAGEVGYPCNTNADCDQGNTCLQWQDPTAQKWCSRECANDDECPDGSFCFAQGGFCMDACDSFFEDDCAPDLQCVSEEGFGDYCWGVFPESECTTGCLPAGAACDPTVADQCGEGQACIEWTNGATCADLGCLHRGGHCDAGFSCIDLGSSLSACLPTCDPTDPDACGDAVSCQANIEFATPDDRWFLTQDAADCVAPFDQSMSFTDPVLSRELGRTSDEWVICYDSCDTSADCGFGQTCFPTLFLDGEPEVGLCGLYTVNQGACPAACGDADCADAGGGYAFCYTGCADNAECGTEFGASCEDLGPFSACINEWASAVCLPGCTANGDCGYCETDADCPKGQSTYNAAGQEITYDEVCDFATNMCVVPVQAACDPDYEGYDPDGRMNAAGATSGACARTCADDTECLGTCGADGFCVPQTILCNGPTGQCEAACEAAGDCLHGQCAMGDVDGYNRCVLGCEAGCGEGFCDDTVEPNYCVLGCQDTGCNAGATCNETTGFCVADPAITVLTAGGEDVLDGAETVTTGTVTIAWEATDATTVTLATGDVPETGGCAAATFADVAGAATTATGTHDLDVAGNVCVRLTAEGELASAEQIFLLTDAPGLTNAAAAGAVNSLTGGSVAVTADTTGAATWTVVASFRDASAALVGTPVTVCDAEAITADGTQTCTHVITEVPTDSVEVIYDLTATDTEGDETTATTDALAFIFD